MTFCPEWLTGSPNLNTANWLHFWVYLVVGFTLSIDLHHIIVNIIFACTALVYERHVSHSLPSNSDLLNVGH
jgi:hypothetical protein